MTELSRNLIAAAREGLGPDAAAAARVRARVLATVGAPAAATAVATPAKAAGATGLALKLGAAVVALALVVTGVALTRRSSVAQAPRIAPAVATTDEPASKVLGAAAEAPVPVSAASSTPPPAPHKVVVPVESAPAATAISLAREVELLDRAMISLRSHDPASALSTLAIYEREARGQGQMAEDAAAIAIEAHCALHHPVADRLAAFDRAYPSSAQRERLQSTCYGH